MPNVVVITHASNADIIDVDFGDYTGNSIGHGATIPDEAAFRKSSILKVLKYDTDEYVHILLEDRKGDLGDWYVTYNAGPTDYFRVDTIEGVTISTLVLLYDEICKLIKA